MQKPSIRSAALREPTKPINQYSSLFKPKRTETNAPLVANKTCPFHKGCFTSIRLAECSQLRNESKWEIEQYGEPWCKTMLRYGHNGMKDTPSKQ